MQMDEVARSMLADGSIGGVRLRINGGECRTLRPGEENIFVNTSKCH